MTKEPDYVSESRSLGVDTEKDRTTAVDLLYEAVEQAWANGTPFEGIVSIIKYARAEYGLGLLESKRLVDDLRSNLRYKQNLKDMGL
tara:strand:- start:349 stop:609 length:261 start_codon:yes stop_codon:yes gene_type:complete